MKIYVVMNKRPESAIGVLLLVSLALAAAACASSSTEARPPLLATTAPPQPANDTESALKAYKQWKLVNPQPAQLSKVPPVPPGGAVLGTSCSDPVAVADDPHAGKIVFVYVNAVGEHAMLAEKQSRFPPGSMIIKEKRDAAAQDYAPVLLTAMVKHEPGYDAQTADWEFLVLDGAATKVAKPAHPESCWACHASYQRTDYITRLYLPPDARAQLR